MLERLKEKLNDLSQKRSTVITFFIFIIVCGIGLIAYYVSSLSSLSEIKEETKEQIKQEILLTDEEKKKKQEELKESVNGNLLEDVKGETSITIGSNTFTSEQILPSFAPASSLPVLQEGTFPYLLVKTSGATISTYDPAKHTNNIIDDGVRVADLEQEFVVFDQSTNDGKLILKNIATSEKETLLTATNQSFWDVKLHRGLIYYTTTPFSITANEPEGELTLHTFVPYNKRGSFAPSLHETTIKNVGKVLGKGTSGIYYYNATDAHIYRIAIGGKQARVKKAGTFDHTYLESITISPKETHVAVVVAGQLFIDGKEIEGYEEAVKQVQFIDENTLVLNHALSLQVYDLKTGKIQMINQNILSLSVINQNVFYVGGDYKLHTFTIK